MPHKNTRHSAFSTTPERPRYPILWQNRDIVKLSLISISISWQAYHYSINAHYLRIISRLYLVTQSHYTLPPNYISSKYIYLVTKICSLPLHSTSELYLASISWHYLYLVTSVIWFYLEQELLFDRLARCPTRTLHTMPCSTTPERPRYPISWNNRDIVTLSWVSISITGCVVLHFLPLTILYHQSSHRCSVGRPSVKGPGIRPLNIRDFEFVGQ